MSHPAMNVPAAVETTPPCANRCAPREAAWSGQARLLGRLGALLLFAFLLLPVRGVAQAAKATLLGTVTDASGASVPEANVTIRERDTGITFTARSNESGNYVFPDLTPGDWDIVAEHAGFKQEERASVKVDVNSTVRVDLKLQAGSVGETVEVNGDAPLLQTDRADISATFDKVQVEDLPLDGGRNAQSVQSLLPGVSDPLYIHTSFANPQNAQSFHVNGQAVASSSVQIEGIDDNERTGQLVVYIPPAAAIQTVSFTLGDYDAEFGRALGSITNFILKSGTNQVHGQLYEYNEISALASKSYFNPGAKPRLVNNYFGGAVGGPIVKNKAFFFVDVLRYTDNHETFNLESLPSMAYRSGNFLNTYNSAGVLQTTPIKVYDPATGNATTGASRTQVSCNNVANTLCMTRFNTISSALLGYLPAPNVAGNLGEANNYTQNTSGYADNITADAKLDAKIHQDSLSLRYSRAKISLYEQPLFGLAGGPTTSTAGATGTGDYHLWNTAIEDVHPISTSLLTEVRFGVTHYINLTNQSDWGSNFASNLGLNLNPYSIFNAGMPEIKISGYSAPLFGYYESYPAHHAETDITLVNNWTKTRGNHVIKFGGQITRLRDDQTSSLTYDPRGNYEFSNGQTEKSGTTGSVANAVASFLLDVPNTIEQQTVLGDQSWRQTLYAGFVQDQWNALPRLTVTAGLRYELYPPSTPSKQGGFSNYDITSNTITVGGYGGNPSNLGMRTQYTDFAPRLGLSYRATETTVVRAGFGISYAPWLDNRYGYGNYPVQQNIKLSTATSYAANTLPNGQVATWQNGLPAVVPATVPANGVITNPSTTASYNVINTGYVPPYVTTYNLTLQQALPGDFTFDIGYVGNFGRQIPLVYNLNAGMVAGAGTAGQPQFASLGRTADTDLFYRTSSSNYNGLQVRLIRRFKRGLSFTGSYAWQKAMGFISPSGSVPSPSFYIDYHRNYAPLAYNQPETAAASLIYQLPFGVGKPWLKTGVGRWVAGGWNISAITSLRAGFPLTFQGSSSSTIGINARGTIEVLNQVAPFHKLYRTSNVAGNTWFDTTGFAQPAGLGTQGNTGINIYSGPGSFRLNMSLLRDFSTASLHEGSSLRVRIDAFQVLNNPIFGSPDTVSTDAAYGTISSTTPVGNVSSFGRVIQLGAVFSF